MHTVPHVILFIWWCFCPYLKGQSCKHPAAIFSTVSLDVELAGWVPARREQRTAEQEHHQHAGRKEAYHLHIRSNNEAVLPAATEHTVTSLRSELYPPGRYLALGFLASVDTIILDSVHLILRYRVPAAPEAHRENFTVQVHAHLVAFDNHLISLFVQVFAPDFIWIAALGCHSSRDDLVHLARPPVTSRQASAESCHRSGRQHRAHRWHCAEARMRPACWGAALGS